MNFFSHAAMARYECDDSGFVLGSMLPDFASMIRARPPRAARDEITAGIAYHHRTDEVFHDSTIFRALCASAFDALRARGVRRGSARAVAHVGIEILLDAVLARDEQARLAYRRALEASVASRLGQHLSWLGDGDSARFDDLRAALERRGVPESLSAEDVVWRLSRALAGRPLLALAHDAEPAVLDWVIETQPRVSGSAAALIAQVRQGLLRAPGGESAASPPTQHLTR
jgi:acyl carrier protein phosphodiesterase